MAGRILTIILTLFFFIIQELPARGNKQNNGDKIGVISPVGVVLDNNKLYFLYMDGFNLWMGETNFTGKERNIKDNSITKKRVENININGTFLFEKAGNEFLLLCNNILYMIDKEKDNIINDNGNDVLTKKAIKIQDDVSAIFTNGNDCFYLTIDKNLFFLNINEKKSTELQLPDDVLIGDLIIQLLKKESFVNILKNSSNALQLEILKKNDINNINSIIINEDYFSRYAEIVQNINNENSISLDDWQILYKRESENYDKNKNDIQNKFRSDWSIPMTINDDAIINMNTLNLLKDHKWIPLSLINNLKIDDKGNISFIDFPKNVINIKENNVSNTTNDNRRINENIKMYNRIIEIENNVTNYSTEGRRVYNNLKNTFIDEIKKITILEVNKFIIDLNFLKYKLSNLEKEYTSLIKMDNIGFENRNYDSNFDYFLIKKTDNMSSEYVLLYKKEPIYNENINDFYKIGQYMNFMGLFEDKIYTIDNNRLILYDAFTLNAIETISSDIIFSIGCDIFMKYDNNKKTYSLQKLIVRNGSNKLIDIEDKYIESRNVNKNKEKSKNDSIFWSTANNNKRISPLISINTINKGNKASISIKNKIIQINTPVGSNIALLLEDL